MGQSLLNFLLIGNDLGAARAIERVGAAAELTGNKMSKSATASEQAWTKAGKALNAVGKWSTVAAIGIGVAGVKAAIGFESAMTRVSTQAGVSKDAVRGLSNEILQLSPHVGFNPDDLATSLYHVESAFRTTGITAGKAIDIVKSASELARIGNADLESTTQAVIGTLASGIKGISGPQDAAAQLNQLVGAGDTTLSAVVKSIATGILPVAHTLGLSFKDVAAALATLTDNATPADEAATRLRTTLSNIERPSKGAIAALRSIGLSNVSLAEDLRKPDGLLIALQDLKTHLDTTYPPSDSHALSIKEITAATSAYKTELLQTGASQKSATDLANKFADSLKAGGSAATLQAQTILAAFGGAKSGSTFLTLFDEFPRFTSKIKDFGTSAQAAAKFQAAWAQQQGTAAQKLHDLDASWHVFLVKVGNEILPDLKRVVDVLAQHPGIIKAAAGAVAILAAAWTGTKILGAINSVGRLTTAILGIGPATRTAAAESGAALGGGAAAGEGGLIARLLGGGATLGPLALGIAGIAGGIHEIITDGQVKNLPALDVLAKLIASGGLKGKGAAGDVTTALSTARTGNNRGESINDYLKRTLSSDVATANGLSYAKFFKIIQTGTRGDLQGFIAAYRSIEFQLKGSPNTISKVDEYLTALFNRYNSARVAAGQLTEKQKEQARQNYLAGLSASYLSTNVANLSKTYGVNGTVAKQLAAVNKDSLYYIKSTVSAMTGYGITLDKNNYYGKQNINQVQVQTLLAKNQAAQVLKLTGNQDLANATLRSESIAFEQAAVKAGFNKDQIDALIRSFGGLPKDPQIDLKLNGADLANQQLVWLEQALARVEGQHLVDIQVATFGAPTSGAVISATGGGSHGFGAGRAATGGVKRGWTWVGENGPELVHLGSTSRVLSNRESMSAGGGGGGNTYIISALDSRSFEDFLARGGARKIQEAVNRRGGFGGNSL